MLLFILEIIITESVVKFQRESSAGCVCFAAFTPDRILFQLISEDEAARG